MGRYYRGNWFKNQTLKKIFFYFFSGLTKQWDLSHYDNLKYPASKYFDPDNGKGVTHLDVNSQFLATGHGNLVLIWSLDTANILSEAICLDSQLDFIGTLALSRASRLTMITRFNGFLRVYNDIYQSKFEEYKLDALPRNASLSSEAFVYSYQFQDSCPFFWHYRLCITKICSYGIEKHMFDMKREVGCIFQVKN